MGRVTSRAFGAFLGCCGLAAAGLLREANAPQDAWFQQNVLDQACPVVVKFGAAWCPPCQAMDPVFKRLSHKYTRARFVKINVDEYPELFAHYGSGTSIPQVVVFKLGRPVAYEHGFGGDQQLDDWLFINL